MTGGSGDIGTGIAAALARAGADVAVSYVGHREGAERTAALVEAEGRRSLIVPLDQRDPASIDASVTTVIDGLGRVDMLINNAGWNIGIPFTDLDALTADIWNRVHETNLRGPYLLSRAFAPHLRAHGAGRIVNIASVGGLRPSSSSIAYSASKAGLIHLTRCLAVALAPTITVNCVAPGSSKARASRTVCPKPSPKARDDRRFSAAPAASTTSPHRSSRSVAPIRSPARRWSSTAGCRGACTERSSDAPKFRGSEVPTCGFELWDGWRNLETSLRNWCLRPVCGTVAFGDRNRNFNSRTPEPRNLGTSELGTSMLQDLQFAIRLLIKDKWFTLVAMLALALGIGVNATVFTFVNAVLIRGLPVDDPDRVMALNSRDPVRDRQMGVSYLDFKDWKARRPRASRSWRPTAVDHEPQRRRPGARAIQRRLRLGRIVQDARRERRSSAATSCRRTIAPARRR